MRISGKPYSHPVLALPCAHAATLPDGRVLQLPIHKLKNSPWAPASLIINQAGFAVVEVLASALAERLTVYAPEIIVDLPTLGLTLAAAVARKLDHACYVPFGTSEKFWCRQELSVSVSSVTTPDQQKRLFMNPRMLPSCCTVGESHWSTM